MLKFIEIKDHGTCIPVIAISRDGFIGKAEKWMLDKEGYAPDTILLVKLSSGEGHTDAYEWPNQRTMTTAHDWIVDNWSNISSGDVVDVRYILKETDRPAKSDRLFYADVIGLA